MSEKTREPRPRGERAGPNTDTASYDQLQGGRDGGAKPNERNPRLPHERDESARATGERRQEKPRPSEQQISQAGEDVESGLVDTDRRGVPNDLPNRKST